MYSNSTKKLKYRTFFNIEKIKGLIMKNLKFLLFVLSLSFMVNANAGYELVCKGGQARTNHKIVTVDCNNRKAFIDTLGAAWRELRSNSIGGSLEDMCWKAYNQAKEMHPSISFANVSDSFLMRCNMGLAYVK